MADEPVSVWREPWTVRTRRWVVRHRTSVATLAVTAIVMLVALSYVLYQDRLRALERRTAADGRVDALAIAQVRAIPVLLEQLGGDRILVRNHLARLTRRGGVAGPLAAAAGPPAR